MEENEKEKKMAMEMKGKEVGLEGKIGNNVDLIVKNIEKTAGFVSARYKGKIMVRAFTKYGKNFDPRSRVKGVLKALFTYRDQQFTMIDKKAGKKIKKFDEYPSTITQHEQ